MKFFLLRLDRFTQFLYTSSVIISLELVVSDLRSTVSEDLLLEAKDDEEKESDLDGEVEEKVTQRAHETWR